ncbi:MAG: type II secretion system F family protein [Chloroflexota bacterium]|nr:type II secretion system F family protein [Chloroflexota bacterium]
MSELFPALISSVLCVGVLFITFAIVRLRSGGDLWSRLEPSQKAASGDVGSKDKAKPVQDFVANRMKDSSFADKIARKLVQADVRLTPAEYVSSQVAAIAVGALVGIPVALRFGFPIWVGGLLLGAVGFFVPSLVVKRKRAKRVSQYNAQLGESTLMLANSLRAGYSLLQSMDLISRDAPVPTSTEFRRVVQEVGVGLSLNDALANLLRRVPSEDLDLLITAISVQQEVGGNLSQVLEQIAHTIRERVRIKGEVKVLTSQGRYSGYVITALPFGMAMIISVINPGYMSPLWTFPWICLPLASLGLIGLAFVVIRKIVNIEV